MYNVNHEQAVIRSTYLYGPSEFDEQRDLLLERVSQDLDWELVDPVQPDALMGSEAGQAIRFIGRIASISVPYCPESLAKEDLEIVDLKIQPNGSNPIECIPVPNTRTTLLFGQIQKGVVLEFLGFFARVPVRVGKETSLVRHFYIREVREVTTDLVRIQATRAECKDAETKIKGVKDVHAWIQKQLVVNLGLKGLGRARELKMAVDAVVLQSLSLGQVENVPTKIHTMVIGSPGTGKKLLSRVAERLNPIYMEVQPAKCTVAGIQSTAVLDHRHYVAKPGFIPMASGGVCAFQDFHQVQKKADVSEVFNMVIEDGVLIDGTAAKTAIVAETALHVDLNRKSHLSPGAKVGDPVEDIGLKFHILSRFDVIIEVPRDIDRQLSVVEGMLTGERVVGPKSKAKLERLLKVIVAMLRDRTQEVTIPDPVMKQVRTFVKQQATVFDSDLYSDFVTRMSNSALKLIAAHARLRQESKATIHSWVAIRPLLETKITFLQNLVRQIDEATSKESLRNVNSRHAFLRARFAGKVITSLDVVEAVKKEGQTEISRKTAERDLKVIAHPEQHGKWRIAG